jgi:hypothetical protein
MHLRATVVSNQETLVYMESGHSPNLSKAPTQQNYWVYNELKAHMDGNLPLPCFCGSLLDFSVFLSGRRREDPFNEIYALMAFIAFASLPPFSSTQTILSH